MNIEKPIISMEKEEDIENDLRNEEVVERVLVEGDPTKLEKMRKLYGLSHEKVVLFREFALLRKKTHQKMREALHKRVLSDIDPSPEEESLCSYKEEIEPHVWDAVILMRKKGYNTYESGFYGGNLQRVGVHDNSLMGIELSPDLINFIREKKVELKIDPDGIEFLCNKYVDTEELKEIWDEIALALPESKRSIKVNEEAVISFRRRSQNMKNNPERFFD